MVERRMGMPPAHALPRPGLSAHAHAPATIRTAVTCSISDAAIYFGAFDFIS
jgi:hypothetical protein